MRRVDETLALITKIIDPGVADWDIASDEYIFSARYCELLGYAPRTLNQSHATWLANLHPENREFVQSDLRSHLENQTPFDVECKVKVKSGDYRWFRFRGQATYNGRSVASHMIKAMSDISLHKAMELEIANNRIQLKNLSLRVRERQEAERKHIARELHDEIGQVLTVFKLNLQSIVRVTDNTAVAKPLKQ